MKQGLVMERNPVAEQGGLASPIARRSARQANVAGIRIGDAKTGQVTAFIPDHQEYKDGESGVEFLAVDASGNIYAGEVTRQRLIKYVPIGR